MNTNYLGYEHPAVAVDICIFTVDSDRLKVMLVKRAGEPFAACWSLPGGFLKMDESLEDAAMRVLHEKTSVGDVYLEQLYTFGAPERDPRARVITVAYFALIPWKKLTQPGSDKVADLTWASMHHLPRLAFDHKQILQYAIRRLQAKAGYSNIIYALLPEQFRLSELQAMYEAILNHKLDKRNFRKRILATGLLQETGRKEIAGAHRPAMLYKFRKKEIAFF
ncbi:MAG: NUDIX hydrolase [Bacteroidota bacterium]